MHESTKDTIQGTIHEIKGTVKTGLGKATDNPKLTAEGHSEKLVGKIQKKVGQVERVLEK